MSPDTARPEDEEIQAAVRALQSGDRPDAIEVIFRRFYRTLFNFFANQSTLREEADDLAQATILRAYQNIQQFRFESSFESWLRKIGENVWKNAFREQRTAKRVALFDAVELTEDEGATVSDEALNPEEAVLTAERTRMLKSAIEALPAGMRRFTELKLFGDLKYREIAEVTGVGLGTVRSQLSEARKRLQPVLDHYFKGVDFS